MTLTSVVGVLDPSAVATYDRLDWHYDSAIAAGQPPENAFTHIGLYLAWIIRHDLHDPGLFPSAHVAALKNGEMTGSDLSDDVDTKLIPLFMNAEGQAFSDARYATYLAEYSKLFADVPDYAVVDDPATYARVAPMVDALHAAWIADGRPTADADATGESTESDLVDGPDLSDMARERVDAAMAELAAAYDRFADDDPHPELMSKLAPELESLIPANITDPPMRTNSVRASTWGSSLLTRSLRRLDVDPKEATVVVAMGGRGAGSLTVMLYAIPGISADRLATEVEPAITLPPSGAWRDREVAGRTIRWASGPEFTVAFWTRDGLVVHVAGSPEDVDRAVPALP